MKYLQEKTVVPNVKSTRSEHDNRLEDCTPNYAPWGSCRKVPLYCKEGKHARLANGFIVDDEGSLKPTLIEEPAWFICQN